MSKCSNCHINEAVIFTTRIENGVRHNEGLCLNCAVKMDVGGITELLKNTGITPDNVEEVTEQINEMMRSLGDQNPAELMQAMMGSDPEAMRSMMENMGLFAVSVEGDELDDDDLEDADDLLDFDEEEDEGDDNSNPSIGDALQMMFGDLVPVEDKESYAEDDQNSDHSDQVDKRASKRKRKGRDRERKFLNQYGTNLTEMAKKGEIEPIVGRTKEINRTIQILNRRTKNNPVILGEPGVGKTALAEGLALQIAEGKVPAKLLGMEVYLLNMTGMVAGTQFRGQFESRMKGVVDEAKKLGNIILVIDELHNIMGAGDAEGSMNAANILKPSLAKGEIRVLGSTTLDEYRRFIEKDSALERRFQKVILDEPSAEETFDILKGVQSYYEKHHHVHYSDEVLRACVTLSNRYIHDRFLPDKAIDIMDEAGSRANLDDHLLVKQIQLKNSIQALENEQFALEEKIAKSEQPSNDLFQRQATVRQKLIQEEGELSQIEKQLQPHEITLDEVASVVELWTGIPVQAINETEAEKLLHLEERLHRRVVGQEQAVSALSRAIRRHRAGIGSKERPSSFIFVGPTGVGKTELVKALAEVIFSDENALIRLDMSEYMEAHTVSKLIGSPPGYVGYDDGGQLTEKIRRRPYSVILLDEIEKAHADVYNMLLQIFDDGRLTDSHGRVVNFKNTIIVMTSNAGTTLKGHAIGFGANTHEALENKVHEALKEIFRPEFLNRVDEIVVFEELSKSELRKIVDLMLADVNQMLSEHGLKLVITDKAKDFITDKGYSPQYGARPLRKQIQRLVEDPLSDMMLRQELLGKTAVSADLAENGKSLVFDTI
ncbi:MAG: ATP-dependent Clp protease ATP-binding subunit [Fastidiosipilaceae bacterium]|nr:ATP-dependent Clp protease ATP-binding subunit [Clostridiaceae bacterium]